MPHYACLCSAWSCWLSIHAYQEKKRVKITSQDLNCSTKIYRVTMPVHDFKCNYDTTAYHKSEHQNRSVRPRGIKLIFMILLSSAKKSYDPSYSLICLNYICHFFFFFWYGANFLSLTVCGCIVFACGPQGPMTRAKAILQQTVRVRKFTPYQTKGWWANVVQTCSQDVSAPVQQHVKWKQ